MPYSIRRLALLAVGITGLAFAAAPAASASVPAPGSTFLIKTVFKGATLCASPNNNLTWPLVSCDKSNKNQQFEYSDNGKCIRNVGKPTFTIEAVPRDILDFQCNLAPMVKQPWTQNADGYVWRQGDNSITRDWWINTDAGGQTKPYMGTFETTNNTRPNNAGTYTFDLV